MLELIKRCNYNDSERIGDVTRFSLNGIEGCCVHEKSKYYPDAGYAYTKISWNDSVILVSDGENDITGTIPSDEELAELSKAFDTSLYDAIKAIIRSYQI